MKRLEIQIDGQWLPAIHGTLNQTYGTDEYASEFSCAAEYQTIIRLLREQRFPASTPMRWFFTTSGKYGRTIYLGPTNTVFEVSNICGGDRRRFHYHVTEGMSGNAIRHCRRQGFGGPQFRGPAAEQACAEWDLLSEG